MLYLDEPNPQLAEFQEQYLIENAEWLEEVEAYRMMAESDYLG